MTAKNSNSNIVDSEIILSAVGIHKTYISEVIQLPVLKGIDLDIYRGEIVVVIGPSGVGKSTLLNILGSLDRPTRGTVYLDRVDIFSMDDDELARFRNRTIGFVFQFHYLLPEFTALENVMMPSLIRGDPFESVRKSATQILKEVGLGERLNHKPSELSGGEKQRVAVARALINNPRIILADEPSGNLDRENSEMLHNLLWKLSREKGQTFLIVTHNLQIASRADRVIELFDGKLKSESKLTDRIEYKR
ncbi:MAG: ABC transporter ATP-binding protein [Fidelibacterota bacterium]